MSSWSADILPKTRINLSRLNKTLIPTYELKETSAPAPLIPDSGLSLRPNYKIGAAILPHFSKVPSLKLRKNAGSE